MKMDDEMKVLVAAAVFDAVVNRNQTPAQRATIKKVALYALVVWVLGFGAFYTWLFLRSS